MTIDYLKLADEAAALLASDDCWDVGLIERLEQAVRELVRDNQRLRGLFVEAGELAAVSIQERDEARAELEQTTLAWQGEQKAVTHWMKQCDGARANVERLLTEKNNMQKFYEQVRTELLAEGDKVIALRAEVEVYKGMYKSADVGWKDCSERLKQALAEVERLQFYEILDQLMKDHALEHELLAPTDTYAYEMDRLRAEVERLSQPPATSAIQLRLRGLDPSEACGLSVLDVQLLIAEINRLKAT